MELFVLICALIFLAGVLRWSISTHRGWRSTARRRGRSRNSRRYGLLVEVATVPSTTAAAVVRERLHEAGVRSTTTPADDPDRLSVLVFDSEQRRALSVLLDEQWPQQPR